MATAPGVEEVKEVNEVNELECSVCHEPFRQPKVLPCGHLLCRPCLLSWLQSKPQARCPLCRCHILEGEEEMEAGAGAEAKGAGAKGGGSPKGGSGVSLESLVDVLPTDLAMAALIEAQRVLSRDQTCCVCEDVAAASLCLHCRDALCPACTKAHGKLSATRHHRVEELASLTAEQLAAHRPSPCGAHPEETCKLFCATHGLAVCLLCASSTHRGCAELKDLEEKSQEWRTQLGEMAGRLSAGEAAIDVAIGQLERHLQDTETRLQAATTSMHADLDTLQAALDACGQRVDKMAEDARSDVRGAVQDGKNFLLGQRGKLTSHKVVVERAERPGP